jgi:ubiquinone/menaquinone biosynthesis C-methylase UbiE
VDYDRMSSWYDLIGGWAEVKHMQAGLQRLHVAEGERILEIGPGTGHGMISMARSLGGSGRVYGIDLSGGMLSVARRRSGSRGLDSGSTYARAMGRSCPLRRDALMRSS